MSERRTELRAHFEQQSTEELASILRNRDEDKWRPDVFEVVAEVLKARGESPEEIPALGPQPQEQQLEGVGFGRRAVARGIDLLVHYGVATIASFLAAILLIVGAKLQGNSADYALAKLQHPPPLSFLAALLGACLMHTLSEGLDGSTLGKRLCGIVVIREDGSPATVVGAIKRNSAYYWDAFFFGMVAYSAMSRSPKRQRVGDSWGETMVIRRSALPPSARRSWLRFAGATVTGIVADGFAMTMEVASRFL